MYYSYVNIYLVKSGFELLPAMDICNHKNTDKSQSLNYGVHSITNGYKNENTVMFNLPKIKNTEIIYSYNSNQTNRKLLNSYGFIFEDNKSQYSLMEIALSKKILLASKYNIANTVNSLIDPLFEEHTKSFFDQKSQTFNYSAFLYPTERNNVVLNLIKMYMIKSDQDLILSMQRLIENKWIYYDLEVSARALIYSRLTNILNTKTINVTDILYLLQGTKNYISNLKENSKLNFEYNIKRLYLIVDKEEQLILIKHKKFNVEDIGKIVMDQFYKIKNHLINN